jgi:hypothetical protein
VSAREFHAVRYDAMVNAIAECHRIDEVRDLKNKAAALELYARQARNTEAETRASAVRLRAERRVGELLRELARTEPEDRSDGRGKKIPPGAGGISSPYAVALAQNHISSQSASRYQALANVPAAEFEEALRDSGTKPTMRALLERANSGGDARMPDDTLWFWGRLRDYERDGFFEKDLRKLLEPMTDEMHADVVRLAPKMRDLFERLTEVAK